MRQLTSRSSLTAVGILLFGCLVVPTAASAPQSGANTGWSRLATVPAGTPVIVTLADGRRLQRLMVNAGSDGLVVADPGRIQSRADRNALLSLLRNHPARFMVAATTQEAGRPIQVVERFDRRSIVMVARPPSHRLDSGVPGWFFGHSGPCPNCDARQTLFGSTVLPSPLPAAPATTGQVLYAAQALQTSALPQTLTWPRLHQWLSTPATSFAPESARPEQEPQKQKPEKKPAINVTGNWTMTLEMSMGTANPSLVLKQDGEKLTGTYTGRYGTFDLLGSVKERAIQFTFNMTAEGQTVAMAFVGEIAEDGQTMKGNAQLDEMGEATWSAKKEKEAK